jgi:hypothetical protein
MAAGPWDQTLWDLEDEQLVEAVRDIDRTIADIRSTIFGLERDQRSAGLRGQSMDTVAPPSLGTKRVHGTPHGYILKEANLLAFGSTFPIDKRQ